jgi:hypothetical protein
MVFTPGKKPLGKGIPKITSPWPFGLCLVWECPSDSALHWWLLANSNTHPTGEHSSVGRVSKMPFEYHLVTIQSFLFETFRVSVFNDTLIEPPDHQF